MPAPTLQELGIDRLSVEDRIALAKAIYLTTTSLQAAALCVEARFALAAAVWDSIPFVAEPPIPLTDAQRLYLRKRMAEAKADPENVIPWEQVRANLKARSQG